MGFVCDDVRGGLWENDSVRHQGLPHTKDFRGKNVVQ